MDHDMQNALSILMRYDELLAKGAAFWSGVAA
jgi:hypothetical protein